MTPTDSIFMKPRQTIEYSFYVLKWKEGDGDDDDKEEKEREKKKKKKKKKERKNDLNGRKWTKTQIENPSREHSRN